MAGHTYYEGDAQNRQCNGQRVVDCGFQTDWVKPRTIQLVCVTSQLSRQH